MKVELKKKWAGSPKLFADTITIAKYNKAEPKVWIPAKVRTPPNFLT